jgi:hypothetical protein
LKISYYFHHHPAIHFVVIANLPHHEPE